MKARAAAPASARDAGFCQRSDVVLVQPATLGYNVFGRFIARIEADLEGFARDLRELLAHARADEGRAP